MREAHPLRGQPVDVGSRKLSLPVAAQVTVAQVVGQDIYDVRRRGSGGFGLGRRSAWGVALTD